MTSPDEPHSHDILAKSLSGADDRIRLAHWTPPRNGIFPHVRFGSRWINTLWLLPIAAAALLALVASAQALREVPLIADFLRRYPGIPAAAPMVTSGFPWWLRVQHFLNMFFMLFIIRAGIQILADHPRLYWTRDSTQFSRTIFSLRLGHFSLVQCQPPRVRPGCYKW